MSEILVTGGNGFLAAQIIIVALKRGYKVVATVRSEQKATQTKQSLARRAGDKISHLSFFILPDLEAENAFDEVLKAHQFVAVLHPAAPVHYGAKDPNEMVGPAVGSTKNLLKAVSQSAPTVKRVIITGTMASVIEPKKGVRSGYTYTEADWNPISWEETMDGDPRHAYAGAKKWAEKAAWEFMTNEKPHFELVTFCPPMIFGEVAQYIESAKDLNASSSALYEVLTGHKNENTPPFGVVFVNVTDLATAHILAIDAPGAANQRFISCADGNYSKKMIAEAFLKHYPELSGTISISLPDGLDENGLPNGGCYSADNNLSKKLLGIIYQNLEESMVQFVESVKSLPRLS